jgi:hypothetical protein
MRVMGSAVADLFCAHFISFACLPVLCRPEQTVGPLTDRLIRVSVLLLLIVFDFVASVPRSVLAFQLRMVACFLVALKGIVFMSYFISDMTSVVVVLRFVHMALLISRRVRIAPNPPRSRYCTVVLITSILFTKEALS